MQKDASSGEGESSGSEFRTMDLDEEEGSEFDNAGSRTNTKIDQKRNLRDDRADPPQSPRVRWHRYYYDGAGDGRRGRSGIDSELHSLLNYPAHGRKKLMPPHSGSQTLSFCRRSR